MLYASLPSALYVTAGEN